jgi:undecaprenyl diphosphate synthase
MNGNGRWAACRGLAPTASHVEGATALRTTVEAAAAAGVKTLTLYTVCAADRARPREETDADSSVLNSYLSATSPCCGGEQVQISLIGKHDGLAKDLPQVTQPGEGASMAAAAANARLHLRIVVDYSAHDSLLQAAWHADREARLSPQGFDKRLRELDRTALAAGAVDLLIRTGGAKNRSDFILWEVAYAHLYAADCLWPDFTAREFHRALQNYSTPWPRA